MATSISLVAAGNSYNSCLIILREKGYHLWIEEGADRLFWNAKKDGITVLAYSPPELLGMVVLWETLGSGWNCQVPDFIGELMAAEE